MVWTRRQRRRPYNTETARFHLVARHGDRMPNDTANAYSAFFIRPSAIYFTSCAQDQSAAYNNHNGDIVLIRSAFLDVIRQVELLRNQVRGVELMVYRTPANQALFNTS